MGTSFDMFPTMLGKVLMLKVEFEFDSLIKHLDLGLNCIVLISMAGNHFSPCKDSPHIPRLDLYMRLRPGPSDNSRGLLVHGGLAGFFLKG